MMKRAEAVGPSLRLLAADDFVDYFGWPWLF